MPPHWGVLIEYCMASVFGSRKSSLRRSSATTMSEAPSGVKYTLYGSSTGTDLPAWAVRGSMGVRLPSVLRSALLATHRVDKSHDGTTCCGPFSTRKVSTTFMVWGSITDKDFERRLGT